MKIPRNIKRGDLVLVHWVDITGSGDANPDKAELTHCKTPGWYYAIATISKHECLICARDHMTEWTGHEFGGADTYPLSVVERVEKLR